MTARAALAAAVQQLRAADVPDAAGDARRLLAHVLGLGPDRLLFALDDPLPDAAAARFAASIDARARRQPVAQITGQRLFWGRSFRVTPDVLDPRPETEILVGLALAAPFARVLDLGTGSGAILLSLLSEMPQARGLGVDLSPAALAVAQGNADDLGLVARVELRGSDWFSAVEGRFDLIVSNPPYIAAAEMPHLSPEVRDWEPHLALTPGGDGLDAYRRIAADAPHYLAPAGRILVEIGPSQGAAVAELFAQAGLGGVQVHTDLDGRDRVVAAIRRD